MKEVIVKDAELQEAAAKGAEHFLDFIIDAVYNSVGRELTAETMCELSTEQITLIAYSILREEVMSGGFIQLIHNGFGAFIFKNPFDKCMRNWGLSDLFKLLRHCHRFYGFYHEEIEKDCTDDEFMQMYEKYPDFDEYDDDFVDNESKWSNEVAYYVDNNLNQFIKVV